MVTGFDEAASSPSQCACGGCVRRREKIVKELEELLRQDLR